MAWTVYADSYDTDADLTNGVKTVRFKLNGKYIIRYIRTWLVFYNNPGLTNITMKIYADESSEKGDLLYSSSTTHTKAEIITSNNGVREVYFQFADIALDGDNYYHAVLTGTSSGFSESSHVAWKNSFPFPVYPDGFTQLYNNLPKYPYTFCLIGADF